MTSRRKFYHHYSIVCSVLFVFTLFVGLVPGAQASLSASRLSQEHSNSTRHTDLEEIRRALESDIVSQRLSDYGLSPEEVEAKLATLGDEQVHQIASLSDGVGEGGVLGLVIGVLLVVLLVVLILEVDD